MHTCALSITRLQSLESVSGRARIKGITLWGRLILGLPPGGVLWTRLTFSGVWGRLLFRRRLVSPRWSGGTSTLCMVAGIGTSMRGGPSGSFGLRRLRAGCAGYGGRGLLIFWPRKIGLSVHGPCSGALLATTWMNYNGHGLTSWNRLSFIFWCDDLTGLYERDTLLDKKKIGHFSLVKNASFVKNFATNPEVRQFRQISSKVNIFCYDGQFSSFRHFFVKNEILWSLVIQRHSQSLLVIVDHAVTVDGSMVDSNESSCWHDVSSSSSSSSSITSPQSYPSKSLTAAVDPVADLMASDELLVDDFGCSCCQNASRRCCYSSPGNRIGGRPCDWNKSLCSCKSCGPRGRNKAARF